jgi:hypothetical protein
MPSGNDQDTPLVSDMPVTTNKRFLAATVAAARQKQVLQIALRPLPQTLAVSAPVLVVPVG